MLTPNNNNINRSFHAFKLSPFHLVQPDNCACGAAFQADTVANAADLPRFFPFERSEPPREASNRRYENSGNELGRFSASS